VALGIISNDLTSFFKGMTGANKVTLDIVVERHKNSSCKKFAYRGNVEGLAALADGSNKKLGLKRRGRAEPTGSNSRDRMIGVNYLDTHRRYKPSTM
jgi:hypothetical protein